MASEQKTTSQAWSYTVTKKKWDVQPKHSLKLQVLKSWPDTCNIEGVEPQNEGLSFAQVTDIRMIIDGHMHRRIT
jgi:hypothetical protein